MVVNLLSVTAETRCTLGLIELSVRRVTIEAVLVLAQLMHAGERRLLMATTAIGRRVHRPRTVRLVAARAVVGDFSVWSFCLLAVTARAARHTRLARMGLVTVGALCVSLGSKSVLFGMARVALNY